MLRLCSLSDAKFAKDFIEYILGTYMASNLAKVIESRVQIHGNELKRHTLGYAGTCLSKILHRFGQGISMSYT
jgi:hypothetical protein